MPNELRSLMSPTEEIRSADGRREWRTPSLCLLTARGDVDAAGGGGFDSACAEAPADFVCGS
jgi:hypothetical protein